MSDRLAIALWALWLMVMVAGFALATDPDVVRELGDLATHWLGGPPVPPVAAP